MRTVNGFRQARQFHRPARVVLPLERVASPTVPQCGHTGPSGQSHASTYAKAAPSSAKCGASRADCMANLFLGPHPTGCAFYVKCNIANNGAKLHSRIVAL